MVQPKQIDLSLVLYLHTLKISYSHVVLLQYYKEGTAHYLPKHKLKNDLVTYGFAYDDKILPRGEQLLTDIENWVEVYEYNVITPIKKLDSSKEFQEFWDTFPPSPNFEYKGQTFTGTRNLKTGRAQAEAKYNLILKTGKVTHQQIIDSLKLEIEMRKEESFKKGVNQLNFMKAVSSYLMNKSWEVFLPLVGKQKPVEEKKLIETKTLF